MGGKPPKRTWHLSAYSRDSVTHDALPNCWNSMRGGALQSLRMPAEVDFSCRTVSHIFSSCARWAPDWPRVRRGPSARQSHARTRAASNGNRPWRNRSVPRL